MIKEIKATVFKLDNTNDQKYGFDWFSLKAQ